MIPPRPLSVEVEKPLAVKCYSADVARAEGHFKGLPQAPRVKRKQSKPRTTTSAPKADANTTSPGEAHARTVLVALPAQGPPTLGPAPPAALPASGSCTPVSPLKPLLPPAIAQHGLSNDGPSASRPSESQIELRKVVAADCTPARGQGGGGSSAEGNKIEVCADDKGDKDPLGPNGSAKAGASSTVIKAPRDAQKPLLPSWVVSSRASQGRQLRDELERLLDGGSKPAIAEFQLRHGLAIRLRCSRPSCSHVSSSVEECHYHTREGHAGSTVSVYTCAFPGCYQQLDHDAKAWQHAGGHRAQLSHRSGGKQWPFFARCPECGMVLRASKDFLRHTVLAHDYYAEAGGAQPHDLVWILDGVTYGG
ncbi:hypothetical protein Rhopal_000414-T1 [Rhodotorula paludigena]|uniref:C2H2-type domain-containing protein n=1 Tax=Rhodotorula paludigena TaxID=86838 RepID=A0AAV5GCT5_9BASI|nr:hypothetical protein Rhopal_000414-T1 [Rhodotorula paludigena]